MCLVVCVCVCVCGQPTVHAILNRKKNQNPWVGVFLADGAQVTHQRVCVYCMSVCFLHSEHDGVYAGVCVISSAFLYCGSACMSSPLPVFSIPE